MVYLRKIETKGFKSMGTPVTNVPVENGFVAITGPNGSGKSNLLDAILFGLGENSAKTLRVPNLSALIYDASVEEQKPSSARVSLQFDNSDRRIPVDSDSATITRELRSSGESLYWLNGKHIQRNNLSELLELALINSRGLNIVLQGMITRISELVPDEKRKLIEQMVGVAQFDEKKQLAITQLRDADVKLEVAMAKIGEIRQRVQVLEEQRNDQIRLKQLDDLTKWLSAVSISSRLTSVRKVKEQRRQSSAQSESKLTELQLRLANIKTEEENLETERNELVRSAVDSGTAKLEVEIGRLENELSALIKEREEATNLIDKYSQVLPALMRMFQSQSDNISKSEDQIVKLDEKLRVAEDDKKRYLESQKDLISKRISIEQQLASIQARTENLRRTKESYASRCLTAKEHFNELSTQLRLVEDRLSSDKGKTKFYDENLSAAEKSISDLESLVEAQRNQIGVLQESKEGLANLRMKVEDQLDAALTILERAHTAIIKYDADFSAIEEVASEEIALNRLQSLPETNTMQGCFGKLGNLISFDMKYKRAIAALGREWLNAIIVEDVQSLTRITEASRRLQISRLTVIPLSEVGEPQKVAAFSKGVEDYVSATEVIDCDRKFRGVVNFLFGDSLIVDSPRIAFIAARKGFRAVTFGGDLFEPDLLAFATGYSKSYAKVSDVLNQKSSFEAVRSAMESLREMIGKRKVSLSNLQAKSQTYEDNEKSFNLDVTRTETKLESAKQNLARYLEYAKSFGSNIRESENEIRRISSEIQSKEKQLKAYALGQDKLVHLICSVDLSLFESKISEFGKQKGEMDSKIDAAVSEIRDVNTELIRFRGDLETIQRPNLERLKQQHIQTQESLESKKRLLSRSETRLLELETEISRLRIEEAELLDRSNRYRPLLDSAEGKLKILREEAENVQRILVTTQREHDSAISDLERLDESETSLRGQLVMHGYSEIIEAFDDADSLLKELQDELGSLRNNVNFLADQNYREIFENYKYSSVRKNELEKERNAIVNFIEVIDAEKQRVFVEAFDRINKELNLIFEKMTNGAAWLELEHPESIFDGGIFLMTQFPGQLPRDSGSVSGGQKTVAALSLILAIQAVFPSPFYVFDEVDAPLDSQYSGKMAEILAERSRFSQIIIVSLKDTVISKATSIIGVYMSRGSSKIIRYKTLMEVELRNE